MPVVRLISRILLIVLAAIILLAIGIYWGGHPSALPSGVRHALVSSGGTRVVDEAIGLVQADYFKPESRSRLVNGSVDGVVMGLHDRFSAYLDPSEYRAFLQSSQGEFSGIGVSVLPVKQGLQIQQIFNGSPAKAANLAVGDIITAVNGRSIAGRPVDLATGLIKGKPGTQVTLTISRNGQTFTKTVKRANVAIPIVTSKLETAPNGKKVGIVALASFTQGAHTELRAQVDKLLGQGAQAIVLDLRGNGGGLLDEAVTVASIFVPSGPIVSTAGRTQPRQVFTATGGAIAPTIPVVVLVDRGTASAAEIVTGALQDTKRAQVVGTRTFGKGVFQQIFELSNHGALDITVGQYFLPSGRNIGNGAQPGGGIQPNIQASTPPNSQQDTALQTAVSTVANQVP